MRNIVRRLVHERKAATAVEYGLICALIVLAMMSALIAVGDTTKDLWNNVSTKVLEAR